MLNEVYNFIKENIVTIVGLFLTYLGMKKNFIDSFKLQKTENQLNKVDNLCMQVQQCIYQLFHDSTAFCDKLDEIKNSIICYGSKKSISIFILLREHCTEQDCDKNGPIFIYLNLLLAQIRLDTIGDAVNPELLIKMTLQLGHEYKMKRDMIKKFNNDAVKKLNLDRRFIID